MLTVREMQDEILRLKKENDVCILAHAYQTQDILEVADYTGDSYGLSLQAAKAPQKKAPAKPAQKKAAAPAKAPQKKTAAPMKKANSKKPQTKKQEAKIQIPEIRLPKIDLSKFRK